MSPFELCWKLRLADREQRCSEQRMWQLFGTLTVPYIDLTMQKKNIKYVFRWHYSLHPCDSDGDISIFHPFSHV